MNKEKLQLLKELINNYDRIHKAFKENELSEELYSKTAESLSASIKNVISDMADSIGERSVADTISYEKEKSPDVIYIKDYEGHLRKYEKVGYYARNIIYATSYYKLNIVHFTYEELMKLIRDKEIHL